MEDTLEVEDQIQVFIDQILTSENKENKKFLILELIKFISTEAKKIAEMGDFFEAAEILSSTANLLEEIDQDIAKELLKNAMKYWDKQIETCKKQAKFLEIAELHIKQAEIYRDKFRNTKKEKENILYAIQFLNHEADVRLEFNELEAVARTFQNIANLYNQILNFRKAIKFNKMAIKLAKEHGYYQILQYTYQQLFSCFSELGDYNSAKEIVLVGIEYFASEALKYEQKDILNLNLSALYQIIKKLYFMLNDTDNYVSYAKKEASTYISIAQSLGNDPTDAEKKGTLYRGAALCYNEIQNNLIECASCFFLAGNFFHSIEKTSDAAENYNNAAMVFGQIGNYQKAFELYIKAALNYQNINNVRNCLENFLNAYDLTLKEEIDFNRTELYNYLIQGLNKYAKEKIKTKEFYSAATSILESLKFYSSFNSERFSPEIFAEMVKRVSKNYYKAASFKTIRPRNIRFSYFLAALSRLLLKQIDEAKEIMKEVNTNGSRVEKYKAIVNQIIEWINEDKEILISDFPQNIQKFILRYDEVKYIISLFENIHDS